MAAALLQALLAVAGAPSLSRSGRATIARRRSVSGIRRPARVLHSRARHGAGVRHVTNGRKHERAPPRPRPRPRAHKLCHSLWTNVAALLRQVFVGPCDEHPQDEFISLDAPCEADAKDEGGKDAKDEEVVIPSHLLGPGNMDLEEGQVEDMDLADDDVVVGKDQLLDASIQPEISVVAVQTVIGFEVKLDKGDGTENAPIYESNSISIEESPWR